MTELIILRNSIRKAIENVEFRKIFLSEYKAIFEDSKKSVNLKFLSHFHELIFWSLNNAYKFLEEGDLERALSEMELIHNFPIVEDLENWYEIWFYTSQVPEYLSGLKDIKKAKEFIRILSKLN